MYKPDQEDQLSEEILNKTFENNSSKFYQEHSACDFGDLRERQQKWLEDKFREADEEDTHFFFEQKFDSFFKDFSLTPEVKSDVTDVEDKGGAPQNCNFSREDLQHASETRSAANVSVYTDKGSEIGVLKDSPDSDPKKISNFWKRVDMRQKKVIRGFSGLAKDYFKDVISNKKTSHEMFTAWNECLKEKFPELYQNMRLLVLAQISVMCLSWKFPEKIRACDLFSEEEKEEIIKQGTTFREQRNKCSSSKVREEMLSCPIVRIGKLLYSSSDKLEESFWSQILVRKKAEIVEFKRFKEAHMKDISKIPDISCVAKLFN